MEISATYFNEVLGLGSEVREPYGPLLEALKRIGAEELARRGARADEKLREFGATFPLPGDPAGKDRILPADWMPRIIPRDHWEKLSAGLVQRGRAHQRLAYRPLQRRAEHRAAGDNPEQHLLPDSPVT